MFYRSSRSRIFDEVFSVSLTRAAAAAFASLMDHLSSFLLGEHYFLNDSFLFISPNYSLSYSKNNRFFSPIIMILRYTAFYFQAHFSPRIKNSRKRMNSKLSSDIFRFLIPIRSNPEKKEKQQQQNFWHFNIPRSSPMG